MNNPTITAIYEYPIKSCGGILLNEAQINSKGLEDDRRWMLIDENSKFITQRKYEILSQIVIDRNEEEKSYSVSFKDEKLLIPFTPSTQGIVSATIWDDTCDVELMGKTYDERFSNILGINCRLVYMPEAITRPSRSSDVGLADGYHSLIVSQQSVDELNRLLGGQATVSIANFRPNIVIDLDGGNSHGEDAYLGKDIFLGETLFHGTKLCPRCKIITIDPQTSMVDNQIMKQLTGYRSHKVLNQQEPGIYFGLYLTTSDLGKNLSIGDSLYNQ